MRVPGFVRSIKPSDTLRPAVVREILLHEVIQPYRHGCNPN